MSRDLFEIWDNTRVVGRLVSDTGQYGTFLTSRFQYEQSWVENGYALSPDLPLISRPLVFTGTLPGALADSSPDRWGRRVIDQKWQLEGKRPPNPNMLDYLLEVSDGTRMGSLRIKRPNSHSFLSEDDALTIPPSRLRSLASTARAIDSSRELDQGDVSDVATILRAGTSAGGARPKITLLFDGRLSLAKFRGSDDDDDHLQWEKLALDIAANCHIQVAPNQLVGNYALVSQRFDRRDEQRIGYISAHTVLGQGEFDDSPPYEGLVRAMRSTLELSRDDLAEMFRRIALTIALNNTDDHTRNHGFLRTEGGWRLSPAFDINPEFRSGIAGTPLCNAGADDRNFETLLSMSELFGLKLRDARAQLGIVRIGLGAWETLAGRAGLKEYAETIFPSRCETQIEAMLAAEAPLL